jgi:hypothetical protein
MVDILKTIYDTIMEKFTHKSRKSISELEWEIFELQLRINTMEDQICPNHKHRWRRQHLFFDENHQLQNRYVCGRCGKVIVTPLDYVEDVE